MRPGSIGDPLIRKNTSHFNTVRLTNLRVQQKPNSGELGNHENRVIWWTWKTGILGPQKRGFPGTPKSGIFREFCGGRGFHPPPFFPGGLLINVLFGGLFRDAKTTKTHENTVFRPFFGIFAPRNREIREIPGILRDAKNREFCTRNSGNSGPENPAHFTEIRKSTDPEKRTLFWGTQNKGTSVYTASYPVENRI